MNGWTNGKVDTFVFKNVTNVDTVTQSKEWRMFPRQERNIQTLHFGTLPSSFDIQVVECKAQQANEDITCAVSTTSVYLDIACEGEN